MGVYRCLCITYFQPDTTGWRALIKAMRYITTRQRFPYNSQINVMQIRSF